MGEEFQEHRASCLGGKGLGVQRWGRGMGQTTAEKQGREAQTV